MNGIYLLLGSNLGDSVKMLSRAIEEIRMHIGTIVKTSSIYKTSAWGIEDQPDFLNQALEVDSDLNPQMLLDKINEIELQLGRIRYEKWHERIIDIDILYYGDQIVNNPGLSIPHPENQNRNFVLAPMAEIAPQFIHPILRLTQISLLKNSRDPLSVERVIDKKRPAP